MYTNLGFKKNTTLASLALSDVDRLEFLVVPIWGEVGRFPNHFPNHNVAMFMSMKK